MEIKQGKNLSTSQPIYVVLSMQENYVSGHSNFTPATNYRGWRWQNGYFDEALNDEDRIFKLNDKKMKKPFEVTKFFTEIIVAFFLTNKAARAYLKYQKHNLNNAYVYVFYSGYANKEMDKLLCNG
jgi:hypothetical protein